MSLGPPALASLETFELHTVQQIALVDPISKLQGKPNMCQYKLREHKICGVIIPNLKGKNIYYTQDFSKGPFSATCHVIL